MKKENYSGKAKKDLLKTLNERREALRKIRFGTTGSKTRNVKETSNIKKDVARIMTELNK